MGFVDEQDIFMKQAPPQAMFNDGESMKLPHQSMRDVKAPSELLDHLDHLEMPPQSTKHFDHSKQAELFTDNRSSGGLFGNSKR